MAVVAKPTTKSAGFNLRIPIGNALIANKFCVFCVFCVKQNIIGTQTSQNYAEVPGTQLFFYSYLHKLFFEFADFVARACPATAGAVLG